MNQTLRVVLQFVLVVTAALGGRSSALAGEPCCCERPEDCFLKRLAPVGGWNPYGGGLLHWWPAHCFPCNGAPDDYCRKALPHVCWPPYPPYFIQGPPEIGGPVHDCKHPH
jgi:hypothetical protein